MSKDSFKLFVRKHPELIQYVNNNEMTWQKFYDMYSLYGEENKEAWSNYFLIRQSEEKKSKKEFNFNELIKYIKNVDMESLQKGISGIEKAIDFIQDLGLVKREQPTTGNYQPRPMYKSFED